MRAAFGERHTANLITPADPANAHCVSALRQATIKRLRTLPVKVARSELEFLHLYLIYEDKEGVQSVSLIRQDETDPGILSSEMKTLWGKVDRSKLDLAIYAPLPKYLGKVSTEQFEEQMVQRYNDGDTPEGWLVLGKEPGNVICPSLSELKGLVFQVLRTPLHLPTPPSFPSFAKGHKSAGPFRGTGL